MMQLGSEKPQISLIMVAKNEAEYIATAIEAISCYHGNSLELIVVNDHSTDATRAIVERFAKSDARIKLFDNPGQGKVLGTNFGYAQSSGRFIKFIDADDKLDAGYFNDLNKLVEDTSHCHGAFVTDANLKILATYSPSIAIINRDKCEYISNLTSPPKWSWTIPRSIAKKIFPIPECLPFEDVWISIGVKEFSEKIFLDNRPLYFYRQNKGQTFGGILNFNKATNMFRSRRLVRYIDYLLSCPKFSIYGSELKKTRDAHLLVCADASIPDILKSKLGFTSKLKILIMTKFGFIFRQLVLIKWRLDSRRASQKPL